MLYRVLEKDWYDLRQRVDRHENSLIVWSDKSIKTLFSSVLSKVLLPGVLFLPVKAAEASESSQIGIINLLIIFLLLHINKGILRFLWLLNIGVYKVHTHLLRKFVPPVLQHTIYQ